MSFSPISNNSCKRPEPSDLAFSGYLATRVVTSPATAGLATVVSPGTAFVLAVSSVGVDRLVQSVATSPEGAENSLCQRSLRSWQGRSLTSTGTTLALGYALGASPLSLVGLEVTSVVATIATISLTVAGAGYATHNLLQNFQGYRLLLGGSQPELEEYLRPLLKTTVDQYLDEHRPGAAEGKALVIENDMASLDRKMPSDAYSNKKVIFNPIKYFKVAQCRKLCITTIQQGLRGFKAQASSPLKTVGFEVGALASEMLTRKIARQAASGVVTQREVVQSKYNRARWKFWEGCDRVQYSIRAVVLGTKNPYATGTQGVICATELFDRHDEIFEDFPRSEEELAVMKIQAWWKGTRVRREQKRKGSAATKLQALFRGQRVRKREKVDVRGIRFRGQVRDLQAQVNRSKNLTDAMRRQSLRWDQARAKSGAKSTNFLKKAKAWFSGNR